MNPIVMPIPPDALRQILLLRTLEETDALGKVISIEAREQATRQASQSPHFLTDRANFLIQRGGENLARLVGRVVHPPWHWLRFAGWGIILGAGILGWFTNELGLDRVVDILAFPLLALVIWNLFVFVAMLIPRRKNSPSAARPIFTSVQLRNQIEKHLVGEAWDAPQQDILTRSLLSFFQKWQARNAPASKAKSYLVFHAAALMLAGGMVAGMYYHGLRKEYRASWESTFLEPPALHSVLKVVLGPAAAVTGIAIPSVETLAEMRTTHLDHAQPVGGNAAPFIHLWAATAGLFIGLPRLLLLIIAGRQLLNSRPEDASMLGTLEERYRAEAAGQTSLVTIRPIYFEPESASQEAIRLCVLHLWGGKTRLHYLPKIELGQEEEGLKAEASPESSTVLAFSFATTPEQDVHGELIREMASRTRSLLVITDALSFAARHHSLPEYQQRFHQRQEAWHRVIGDSIPWLTITPEMLKNPLETLDPIRAKLHSTPRTKDAR